MTAILPILSAFYIAVLLTALTASMAELPGRQRKQGIQWQATKRWPMRLAIGSIVLALILLVLFYVDVGSQRRAWHFAFLAAIDLGVLALLLDRVVLVVRNPRASLSRRLARSTVLVVAAAVAFAGFYFTHLTS